jgi:hypothetical protein
MSVFSASTEEKLAVQNLGILFIPYSLTKRKWLILSRLKLGEINFLFFDIV